VFIQHRILRDTDTQSLENTLAVVFPFCQRVVLDENRMSDSRFLLLAGHPAESLRLSPLPAALITRLPYVKASASIPPYKPWNDNVMLPVGKTPYPRRRRSVRSGGDVMRDRTRPQTVEVQVEDLEVSVLTSERGDLVLTAIPAGKQMHRDRGLESLPTG
jgi:hypothetical protein